MRSARPPADCKTHRRATIRQGRRSPPRPISVKLSGRYTLTSGSPLCVPRFGKNCFKCRSSYFMRHSLYSQICFPPINTLARLSSSSQTTKSASLPDSMEPISFSRPISRAGISVAAKIACSLRDAKFDCLAHTIIEICRGAGECAVRELRHAADTGTRPVRRGCTARPACRSSAARRRSGKCAPETA